MTIIPLGQHLKEIKVIESTLKNGTKVDYNDDGSIFMQTHWDFFGEASHQNSDLISK